jgi:hypothetical protein
MFYSNHILMVITISILILSQINAANCLHNKNIWETIAIYTSRLTISHLISHTSDFKVKGEAVRSRITIYNI